MEVVRFENISKSYNHEFALRNVNFSISDNEIVGLLGPNGAGKSTLMKVLTGYLVPDEGSVFVFGKDLNKSGLEARKNIGYLPENNPLYLEMYVHEYLEYVLKFYSNHSGIKIKVNDVIRDTGLEDVKYKRIINLSKGYRQRVGLAQALVHDPQILVLDEPTSGLDPNQLTGIRELIKELGKKKTILLSTHVMQEVEAMCDRVIIINNGNVIADQTVKNLIATAGKKRFLLILKEKIEAELLINIPGVIDVKRKTDTEWMLESEQDIREAVFKKIVENKLNILTLSEINKSLEQIYRDYTE